MADVMTAPGIPTPAQGHAALLGFAYTVAALTIAQGPDDGQNWVSDTAREIAVHVQEQLSIEDVEGLEEDFTGPEALALSVLYREIVYVDRLYEDLTRDVFPGVPVLDPGLFPEIAPMQITERIGKDDVERIDIVYGSLEKLLKRLPPWLRKILDVTMELLKLARGVTG